NEYEGYAISVSRDFLALRRNNLKIPSKYKGKPVIGINDYAFDFNRTEDGYKFITLKKIKIPNTVKYIGVRAFDWNELERVKIPDSVVFIGERAFARNELKKVKIPDSVVFVGPNAFSGNNISEIEDIQLGAGLTDYWVFDEETGELKGHIGLPKNYDLVIPNSIRGKTVTSIASNSFYNINLKSVFIPDSVKHISEDGFYLSNWYNDIVIYGKAGSEAEKYAKKHGMRFVAE
ncbi:MAG: leucine-rich repeat domain-containing protein, partial [Fusobacteria bacterium]|nr:leucine-rich repeat domain-containing protein [Fusobacteriota bacterium]